MTATPRANCLIRYLWSPYSGAADLAIRLRFSHLSGGGQSCDAKKKTKHRLLQENGTARGCEIAPAPDALV